MKRFWRIGFVMSVLVSLWTAADCESPRPEGRSFPVRCFFNIAPLSPALKDGAFVARAGKEVSPLFIEMEVKGVQLDATGQAPVVILADKEGKKLLPIWIGLLEADAIDKELGHVPSPRPMTHDLLQSILAQVHAELKEVKIADLKNNTYYATLFLKSNKGMLEVDARPSDAIILALKVKAPILVAARILNQQGIGVTREDSFGERCGIRIQELDPSLASSFNFKGKKGVLVAEVLQGSAAETSGMKAGDIITQINSKETGSIREFEEIFDKAQKGDSIRILLFRENKFLEVNLLLKP